MFTEGSIWILTHGHFGGPIPSSDRAGTFLSLTQAQELEKSLQDIAKEEKGLRRAWIAKGDLEEGLTNGCFFTVSVSFCWGTPGQIELDAGRIAGAGEKPCWF